MPRTHPPTLITLARAALREHRLIPRGSRALVAVSGGPDSMALLHVLALLRSKLAFGLFAHGVDHGLRPEASAELDRAEAFARSLDVPFSRSQVSVPSGGNLQARARAARWSALRNAASRTAADRIATGHHAEDRAETVLMRILRGTGVRGLAALPPIDGDRIRPLHRARRADIDAHLKRHGIPFSHDPSNRDPRFLRTRVRSDIMPALERLSPRVIEHLCGLADDASLATTPSEAGRGAARAAAGGRSARQDATTLTADPRDAETLPAHIGAAAWAGCDRTSMVRIQECKLLTSGGWPYGSPSRRRKEST
jgi:tRNA(Ile)-lysidine synthase